MASPSEHKEGLRCGRSEQRYPPWGTVTECPGLILEHDSILGLGTRCSKKNCRAFHPLEVSLRRAVERGLVDSRQRKAIRRVVPEDSENPGEQEMTTAKHTVEITPRVYPAIDPAGAIEVMKALYGKRTDIYNELIKCHFPTFDSGEMKNRAGRFINVLARDGVRLVLIRVVVDEHHKFAVWVEINFSDGKVEKFQDSGWSSRQIAYDVAYKFQAFANLLGMRVVIVDETGR